MLLVFACGLSCEPLRKSTYIRKIVQVPIGIIHTAEISKPGMIAFPNGKMYDDNMTNKLRITKIHVIITLSLFLTLKV